MNKLFDTIVWGFLLLFAAPTTMIVASWNALPGDPLFAMKRGLEQTLLFAASPSYAARGTLQVKYTERRFSEATQLLASKASVEGLVYLNDQVDTTTKTVIAQAPNAKTQKELAQSYITTLQTVATELAQQKQVAAAAPPSTQPQQPVARATPVPTRRTLSVVVQQNPPVTTAPAPQAAKPVVTQNIPPAPSVSQTVVVAQIAHTEEKIKETIKEMEKVAKEAEQQEQREEQEKKREEKKDESGGDRGGSDKKERGDNGK